MRIRLRLTCEPKNSSCKGFFSSPQCFFYGELQKKLYANLLTQIFLFKFSHSTLSKNKAINKDLINVPVLLFPLKHSDSFRQRQKTYVRTICYLRF